MEEVENALLTFIFTRLSSDFDYPYSPIVQDDLLGRGCLDFERDAKKKE